MQFLGQFDPGILVAAAALLMLLLTGPHPAAAECRTERCSREFERSQLRLQPTDKSSPEYCRALRRFSHCLRATDNACLGNLYFHTNLRIVERMNKKHNCRRILSQAGTAAQTSAATTQPPTRAPLVQDSVCSYHGDPEPAFCGLFGDPHVRTFDGTFQTCRLRGAWPLFYNNYLAVQVTNSMVASDDRATAPTRLTVIVRQNEPCTRELTYEARGNESLPRTFADGAVSSAARSAHSAAAVTISAVVPGQHMVITLRHINATLVIRRLAGHLTFSARLPRELVGQPALRQGLQLCARGCPERERIDYRHVLSADRPVRTVLAGRPAVLTRDVVANMCREYRLTDFYLDACVFDVLFTGKTAFMASAYEAQRDLKRLMPQAVRQLSNRTQLRLAPSSAALCRPPPLPVVFVLAAAAAALVGRVPR